MKTGWSIRNYNASIREIRDRTGADIATARETYRSLRSQLGESISGADVRRAAKTTDHSLSLSRAFTAARRKQASPTRAPAAGTGTARGGRATALQSAASLADWYDAIASFEDLEWSDYESSEDPIDTGKKE